MKSFKKSICIALLMVESARASNESSFNSTNKINERSFATNQIKPPETHEEFLHEQELIEIGKNVRASLDKIDFSHRPQERNLHDFSIVFDSDSDSNFFYSNTPNRKDDESNDSNKKFDSETDEFYSSDRND